MITTVEGDRAMTTMADGDDGGSAVQALSSERDCSGEAECRDHQRRKCSAGAWWRQRKNVVPRRVVASMTASSARLNPVLQAELEQRHANVQAVARLAEVRRPGVVVHLGRDLQQQEKVIGR